MIAGVLALLIACCALQVQLLMCRRRITSLEMTICDLKQRFRAAEERLTQIAARKTHLLP